MCPNSNPGCSARLQHRHGHKTCYCKLQVPRWLSSLGWTCQCMSPWPVSCKCSNFQGVNMLQEVLSIMCCLKNLGRLNSSTAPSTLVLTPDGAAVLVACQSWVQRGTSRNHQQHVTHISSTPSRFIRRTLPYRRRVTYHCASLPGLSASHSSGQLRTPFPSHIKASTRYIKPYDNIKLESSRHAGKYSPWRCTRPGRPNHPAGAAQKGPFEER